MSSRGSKIQFSDMEFSSDHQNGSPGVQDDHPNGLLQMAKQHPSISSMGNSLSSNEICQHTRSEINGHFHTLSALLMHNLTPLGFPKEALLTLLPPSATLHPLKEWNTVDELLMEETSKPIGRLWPMTLNLKVLRKFVEITGKGKISPGDDFAGDHFAREKVATLEIPKAPSAIRPNDCNNTTRHAPDRDSKLATHCHNKEGQYLQQQLPDLQHQISYICARNGGLRCVRKRLALLRKHNPSAAVAKDETVPPKFRREKFRRFLNGGIFLW